MSDKIKKKSVQIIITGALFLYVIYLGIYNLGINKKNKKTRDIFIILVFK